MERDVCDLLVNDSQIDERRKRVVFKSSVDTDNCDIYLLLDMDCGEIKSYAISYVTQLLFSCVNQAPMFGYL